MPPLESNLNESRNYLHQMELGLKDKLRVTDFILESAQTILDVGCANGILTRAVARTFPEKFVKGIDLNAQFIAEAQGKDTGVNQPEFEKVFLRTLRERGTRYDVILFTSVLHEFYTYGGGMAAVLKGMADAYRILEPGGRIIIRDMILSENSKEENGDVESIIQKIHANETLMPYWKDFEQEHGSINSLYRATHFLLKYFYTDNWKRECFEHYVPVTNEDYESIAELLDAKILHNETYCLPFLREKWRTDFNFDDAELAQLYSTRLLVIEKPKEDASNG